MLSLGATWGLPAVVRCSPSTPVGFLWDLPTKQLWHRALSLHTLLKLPEKFFTQTLPPKFFEPRETRSSTKKNTFESICWHQRWDKLQPSSRHLWAERSSCRFGWTVPLNWPLLVRSGMSSFYFKKVFFNFIFFRIQLVHYCDQNFKKKTTQNLNNKYDSEVYL